MYSIQDKYRIQSRWSTDELKNHLSRIGDWAIAVNVWQRYKYSAKFANPIQYLIAPPRVFTNPIKCFLGFSTKFTNPIKCLIIYPRVFTNPIKCLIIYPRVFTKSLQYLIPYPRIFTKSLQCLSVYSRIFTKSLQYLITYPTKFANPLQYPIPSTQSPVPNPQYRDQQSSVTDFLVEDKSLPPPNAAVTASSGVAQLPKKSKFPKKSWVAANRYLVSVN